MIRKRVAAVVAVLALTATGQLLAQEYNQRLIAKEPGKMGIALCPLRIGGKLSDAQKQLKTGIEDSAHAVESCFGNTPLVFHNRGVPFGKFQSETVIKPVMAHRGNGHLLH